MVKGRKIVVSMVAGGLGAINCWLASGSAGYAVIAGLVTGGGSWILAGLGVKGIMAGLGMSLMPVWGWSSDGMFVAWLMLATGVAWLIAGKARAGKPGRMWGGVGGLLCLMAVLNAGGLIQINHRGGISVDEEKWFVFQTEARGEISATTDQLQTDLWRFGVAIKRSQWIHNQGVIGGYRWLKNLTDFFYWPNFYLPLLAANVYLMGAGMVEVYRQGNKQRWCLTAGITGWAVLTGLWLHVGVWSVWYPLLPGLFYLAIRGAEKIDLKLYLGLLMGQLILLGWR